ncbi:MAG: DUF4249 family protein [Rhodothermales bacterium]
MAALMLFGTACDTVAPVDESRLVVEGYLTSGGPLSTVQVRRTVSPNGPYDPARAAVDDATVELFIGGSTISFAPDSKEKGTYRPGSTGETMVAAGQSFSFRAAWRGTVAEASGIVPPTVKLGEVDVTVPDEPISAVLLDSLVLSDSIATGLYTGYIYPIEVAISWNDTTVQGWSPESSWIRAQIRPFSAFSSPVIDLFLRSDEIFREAEQMTIDGKRRWTGLYAVGVRNEDDPLPLHRVRISIVRSSSDYARFAASKDAPERREPVTNLSGAVGIFAAIAVDSVDVYVEPDGSSSIASHPREVVR